MALFKKKNKEQDKEEETIPIAAEEFNSDKEVKKIKNAVNKEIEPTKETESGYEDEQEEKVEEYSTEEMEEDNILDEDKTIAILSNFEKRLRNIEYHLRIDFQ
jgi:hypothetical protein